MTEGTAETAFIQTLRALFDGWDRGARIDSDDIRKLRGLIPDHADDARMERLAQDVRKAVDLFDGYSSGYSPLAGNLRHALHVYDASEHLGTLFDHSFRNRTFETAILRAYDSGMRQGREEAAREAAEDTFEERATLALDAAEVGFRRGFVSALDAAENLSFQQFFEAPQGSRKEEDASHANLWIRWERPTLIRSLDEAISEATPRKEYPTVTETQ